MFATALIGGQKHYVSTRDLRLQRNRSAKCGCGKVVFVLLEMRKNPFLF